MYSSISNEQDVKPGMCSEPHTIFPALTRIVPSTESKVTEKSKRESAASTVQTVRVMTKLLQLPVNRCSNLQTTVH